MIELKNFNVRTKPPNNEKNKPPNNEKKKLKGDSFSSFIQILERESVCALKGMGVRATTIASTEAAVGIENVFSSLIHSVS